MWLLIQPLPSLSTSSSCSSHLHMIHFSFISFSATEIITIINTIIITTACTQSITACLTLTCSPVIKTHWRLYLLSFLKLQFNGGLDAVAGVLISLFKCQLHQMLVVCSRHVATHENYNIGQNLHRNKGQTKLVLDEYQTKLITESNVRVVNGNLLYCT